jgi:hypothetical protein
MTVFANPTSCQHCGIDLLLAPSGRPKRFCSDTWQGLQAEGTFRTKHASRHYPVGPQKSQNIFIANQMLECPETRNFGVSDLPHIPRESWSSRN